MDHLIPAERIYAFYSAIQAIFNKAAIQEITQLIGGSLSKTYKVSIENKTYIIRLMDLEEPELNRQNQIHCLNTAAKLGIAPTCYYANAQTGIIITDYIEARAIDITPAWLHEVASALHDLHAYNNFPPPHQPLFTYIGELIQSIRKLPLSTLLLDYLQQFEEIISSLSPYLILTSCHNDLNCKNILCDNRTYFIDWEAAGMEDPFFDIATICNEFIATEFQEQYFLEHYFGKTPDLKQHAKFLLMRHVSYCYLALHYLMHAANNGLTLTNTKILAEITDTEVALPNYKFQQTTANDFLRYGMLQIKKSLTQMVTRKFNDAKRILINC